MQITDWRSGAVIATSNQETMRAAIEELVMDGANLDGANLDGANLDGANLDGANLARANLARANLARANLAGAYLARANLAGAYLARANLAGANLAGANLAGANLAGANLAGANLDGANLGDPDWTLIGARPVLTLGPIGSRADYASLWLTSRGPYVCAGCFFDTLDAFRARVVEVHGEGDHGQEYMAVIALFEAHARIWTPAT